MQSFYSHFLFTINLILLSGHLTYSENLRSQFFAYSLKTLNSFSSSLVHLPENRLSKSFSKISSSLLCSPQSLLRNVFFKILFQDLLLTTFSSSQFLLSHRNTVKNQTDQTQQKINKTLGNITLAPNFRRTALPVASGRICIGRSFVKRGAIRVLPLLTVYQTFLLFLCYFFQFIRASTRIYSIDLQPAATGTFFRPFASDRRVKDLFASLIRIYHHPNFPAPCPAKQFRHAFRGI